MPLIKASADVDDLNSFIDIAITDDNEINPIIGVSRVQKGNRSEANSKRSGNDSTSWRARGAGSSCDNSREDGEILRESDNESFAASSRQSGSFAASRNSGDFSRQTKSNPQSIKSASINEYVDAMSKEEDDDVVFPLRETEEEYKNEAERLEQEIAKISFELAESQAQVDWYKMNYRHLHVEFADLQAFCQQLQDENMELRDENKKLRNGARVKPKKRSAWFENATLMNLGKPRPIVDYGKNPDDSDCDDWDDDTLTTNFCESSRSFLGDSASRGGFSRTDRKHDKPGDKPENIIFGVKDTDKRVLGLE